MIKEVEEECRGDLLQYFIEDLKTIAERWRECERVKKYEDEKERYEREVNDLYCWFMAYGIPQEIYEERLKELYKPLPLEFYLPPSLPDSFQWALDRLKESLAQPDTSTPVSDPNSEELSLPPGPGERKYFKRAMERGYIKTTSTGLEWVAIGGRGGNAQLGYFLSKIYPQPRPINELERLFNVKKLSTNLTNAGLEIKRADVVRWRTEINNIFND